MENRLREFQEAAAASDSNLFSGSHQIGSGLGGGADDIEMGTISSQPDSNTRNLDPFLSIIEAIRERVERIKQAAASVELLHRVILASVGGEEASDAGKKISLIVKKVNEDAQFVRSALKTAYRETETAARTNALSSSDLRGRSGQQTRWARRFMVAMQTFQKMQSEYHERYRKHLQRQLLIVKPDLTPAELDEMTDSASFFNPKDSESGPDQTGLLSQRIFSLASRSLNRQKLEELRETQQEILAIERSISELHQMFVDIAIVVQQQGDLIDRVETHVDSIVDFTELAGVQVEQVVLSRRRSQRRKWICLVIIIVILIIVAIALWCTFAPSHQR